MTKKPNWIHEQQAAEMVGYKPETLRRYVKAGRLQVAFTNLNGRNFQYDQADIEKVLLNNSTFIK